MPSSHKAAPLFVAIATVALLLALSLSVTARPQNGFTAFPIANNPDTDEFGFQGAAVVSTDQPLIAVVHDADLGGAHYGVLDLVGLLTPTMQIYPSDNQLASPFVRNGSGSNQIIVVEDRRSVPPASP